MRPSTSYIRSADAIKDSNRSDRPFSSNGASTVIGLELAKQCAANGYELPICAAEE